MTEQARPPRPSRTDSREAVELRALKEAHPELGEAVDMHLELLELQRRIQSRVSLPWIEITKDSMARQQAVGHAVLRFEEIPLDLSDLRLIVRQTADVLHRHGALEDSDYQKVQSIGRDMKLLEIAGQWYRSTTENHAMAAIGSRGSAAAPTGAPDAMVSQVLSLAMRPFLSRCAEVLQQRPELALWAHSYCALCGGEPDFSVITPAAERHLICSRCTLRWKWDPLACPYCGNSDRARITSFATPDGKYRVYACDVCHRYLKTYDGRRTTRPVMPVVDMVATLPLDAAAIQRGYS